MYRHRGVLRNSLLVASQVAIALLVSSCFLFDASQALKGLWQGTGEAEYSIHVWEGGTLVLEDTWQGTIELTVDVKSARSGSILGEWYWRDLSEGTQYADPSAPLPFIGTVTDDVLLLRTTDEQALPVPTQYEAQFEFAAANHRLLGGGTYSEDGESSEARILFEISVEEIVLSQL